MSRSIRWDQDCRPLRDKTNTVPQDPSTKIGPSKILGSYFDLPAKDVQSESAFSVYSDAQFEAAKILHEKEISTGNQIKLCVGVDASVTELLRLSKESGELNRRLLRDREDCLARHPREEAEAREVYNKVKTNVVELLGTPEFNALWPFVFVFSCYEFTSHRRNFQHGHCLYLMVTVTSQQAWELVDNLHKLLSSVVGRVSREGVLHIVVQEIDSQRPLHDGPPRLLESNKGPCLPRNIEYHSRPYMGSSIGPVDSGMSCTVGGYVTTQNGSIYALTASHAVGEPGESVVSPSVFDLRACFRQGHAKEEIALQELEYNLRTIGQAHSQTLDSRRRWEILQEELLALTDKNGSVPSSAHFGVVAKKCDGAFYTQIDGMISKTQVDFALIQCNGPRLGFNMIPYVLPNGTTGTIEVNTARSPIPGEPIIKNGRTTGLTFGNVLAVHAVCGFFEPDEVTTLEQGDIVRVQPHILQNWCITGRRKTGTDGLFAAPGDSGAWILAEPPAPQAIDNGPVLTTHTPVLGALMHGFISKEGVDLIMFQPWEVIGEGFKNLMGEDCAPCLPLSDQIDLFREKQGLSSGCGICLQQNDIHHHIDHCPERFVLEGNRSFFVRGKDGIRVLAGFEPISHRNRLHQVTEN
ncbi:hypothetical protein TWF694_003932 [Orbilia ellipsospora]|uniref:Uncharacterized protein n=1 Tax=Orbilia ellipsospora TaxID=2528407 RepID=A0AAV9WXX8_9PEZI